MLSQLQNYNNEILNNHNQINININEPISNIVNVKAIPKKVYIEVARFITRLPLGQSIMRKY